MINNKSVLAFIPARGGSKGLPNKNILDLNGKQLIAYTILAAKKSGICDEIMVSTDSEEIANISKKFGANIPFIRPSKLASDNSPMMDVIMHTIKWYENRGKVFDIFLYLQPTSPLRNSSHIKNAFSLFFKKKVDVVVSINKSPCIKERMGILSKDIKMTNFISSKYEHQNRQDLNHYYELNGAICIAKWDIIKEYNSWYVENSLGYIMKDPYYLDIDTKMDFYFAEFLLEKGYV